MSSLGALVTKKGKELLAQAIIAKKDLELSEVRFSDYKGDIDENMNILVGVKHTCTLTNKTIDTLNLDTVILETLLPSNVGGFYINTLGIYTLTGELFALVRIKETYKTITEDLIPTDIQFKIHICVSGAEHITINIDESVVLASRDYVNAQLLEINKRIDSLVTLDTEQNITGTKHFKDLSADKIELADTIELEAFKDPARTAELNAKGKHVINLETASNLVGFTVDKLVGSKITAGNDALKIELEEAIKVLADTKANQATTYTKTEVDTKLVAKADKLTTYTKTEVDTKLVAKADKLTTYTKAEIDAINTSTSRVTLKSTRTTEGIWTIAGLIPYKPVIVTCSSTSSSGGVQLAPNSNIAHGGALESFIGNAMMAERGNSVIYIPVASNISLNIKRVIGQGNVYIYAYQ